MATSLVETRSGWVQGVEEDGCIVFKGIPYAQPPVGALRFATPRPCVGHEGTLAADTFPNRSWQMEMDERIGMYKKEFYDDPVFATPMSEDCLYLNIWAPEGDASGCPVAFYIHGGAFDHGCGHEVEFRTGAYAQRGVILVTINYRVGAAGFLCHPWLAEEDARACGMYGILDQIAALEWVRDNIGAFGGDPGNITVFGQSAGAMSTKTLLISDEARGLFSKAILQSCGGYPSLMQDRCTLEDGFEVGRRFADMAGADTLEELRALPAERIFQIQDEIASEGYMKGRGPSFTPIVNGYVLAKPADQLIEGGAVASMPTMIGVTSSDISVTPDETASKDSQVLQSCVTWSKMLEEQGKPASYVYLFDRALPGDDAGAFHSSELWYMLGTLGSCWRPMTDGDFDLSERMLGYWTDFMKTGDPNGSSLDKWKPCTAEDPFVMTLDIR